MRRALAVAVLALGGCVLHPPEVRDPPLRARAPLSQPASGSAIDWPAADWWKQFSDPVLDELMSRALEGAPSLNSAAARLASARQDVRVSGAALGLHVEGQAQFVRQRLSDNGLFPPELLGFNWYSQADLGLAASYDFDWWGRQRSTVEAALDTARAAQAERSAALLGLSGAVAQAYFGWQADAQRADLARQRVELIERRVHITERRVAAELESGDAVTRAQREVAAAREALALAEGSQRLRLVTLAALLGVSVDDLPPLVARPLPRVTGELPGSLGVDLIARRPDVQASRWRVEAARSSALAVRAEYYPDVSLRALIGLSSIEVGRLFQAGSAAPSFTAAVHLPFFDSGLRDARFGARQAQIDAAVADYDETVVDAARDVGNAATRLTQAATQRAERSAQLESAETLLRSASARVRAGTTDLRPQLDAEQDVLREREALAQIDQTLIDAEIALLQALGGGYDSRETAP